MMVVRTMAVIDYDTTIVFRFLPAATGEGFGAVCDGFPEEG
jgi:hypothetical protein